MPINGGRTLPQTNSSQGTLMMDIVIKNLMTTEVKCAPPSTPLLQIIQTMKQDRHSCMVIANNGAPVGIVTERDIVHHFAD